MVDDISQSPQRRPCRAALGQDLGLTGLWSMPLNSPRTLGILTTLCPSLWRESCFASIHVRQRLSNRLQLHSLGAINLCLGTSDVDVEGA